MLWIAPMSPLWLWKVRMLWYWSHRKRFRISWLTQPRLPRFINSPRTLVCWWQGLVQMQCLPFNALDMRQHRYVICIGDFYFLSSLSLSSSSSSWSLYLSSSSPCFLTRSSSPLFPIPFQWLPHTPLPLPFPFPFPYHCLSPPHHTMLQHTHTHTTSSLRLSLCLLSSLYLLSSLPTHIHP